MPVRPAAQHKECIAACACEMLCKSGAPWCRCIPVRISPDGSHLQVLLISSRGGKGLVFPKGGWEQDEDVQAAAARETVEEAGVRGELEVRQLARVTMHSGDGGARERGWRDQSTGRCFVSRA